MFDAQPMSRPMIPAVEQEGSRPLVQVLHDWIVTVDHKKLGLMYFGYGIIFLVIGGIEASLMRVQLAVSHNHFISPETFNRLFTMHGTTMIFFAAMPIVFGFANYAVPLMIGARDMAFPRLNAWSFWMSALGGIILYFSFVGGSGLYGAGTAPDVGWFAYAPLTSPAFSVGHSTDYWIIGILISGFGSVGTALNVLTTILCMRCPGMTLGRMPLFVWMNSVMAFLVVIAIGPLTAAQIMLLLDRYLGAHFFDTQAGGSAVIWMHFFWIFGHPEVYILVLPAFAIVSRSHSSVFAQADLRLLGHGCRDLGHRLHQPERVGAPYVHHRDDLLRKRVLCGFHGGHRGPDRDKDLQLVRHHVGRKDPLHRGHDVLRCLPVPVSHCRIDRHHAVSCAV